MPSSLKKVKVFTSLQQYKEVMKYWLVGTFSILDVTFLLRRARRSVGGQSSLDNSRVARFPPEFSQNLPTHTQDMVDIRK